MSKNLGPFGQAACGTSCRMLPCMAQPHKGVAVWFGSPLLRRQHYLVWPTLSSRASLFLYGPPLWRRWRCLVWSALSTRAAPSSYNPPIGSGWTGHPLVCNTSDMYQSCRQTLIWLTHGSSIKWMPSHGIFATSPPRKAASYGHPPWAALFRVKTTAPYVAVTPPFTRLLCAGPSGCAWDGEVLGHYNKNKICFLFNDNLHKKSLNTHYKIISHQYVIMRRRNMLPMNIHDQDSCPRIR